MPEKLLTHYCVSCGEQFNTTKADIVLCRSCGGLPEEAPADLTISMGSPLSTGAESEAKEKPAPGAASKDKVDAEAREKPGLEAAQKAKLISGAREWQTGDVILDTYEVKGELGQGSFGKVYRVHHRAWNIDLAVKRPLKLEETNKQSFVDEAEKWVELGLHPHIISCYYVRAVDGFPHTFAELAEGGSLQDWIENDDRKLYSGGQAAALERILDIAIQFAWGLAYAHERGLVHQDVKPGNVLVALDEADRSGGNPYAHPVAKVTDFGLAKARSLAQGEVEAVVSAAFGTPAFHSPEQKRGDPLSIHTDIWSWGVSLLEMFAGEVFWGGHGEAAAEILEGFLDEGAYMPDVPKMPSHVADLLRQCFRRDPLERPKDMLEIAGRLHEIYQQEVGQPHPRQLPKIAELRADSLNNKALSLLDLGKGETAISTWEEALSIDPHHPEAVFNLNRLLWQTNSQTDLEVVAEMRAVTASKPDVRRAFELLSAVLVESGDLEGAITALQAPATKEPEGGQLQDRLAELKRLSQAASALPIGAYIHGLQEKVFAISPDEQLLAVMDNMMGHGIYDLATGNKLCKLEENEVVHEEGEPLGSTAIWQVKFSPDGKTVLGSGRYGEICCWEASTGKLLTVVVPPKTCPYALAISPDGRHLISGGFGGEITLYDLSNGQALRKYTHKAASSGFLFSSGKPKIIYNLAFLKNGSHFLAATSRGSIEIWDTNSGVLIGSDYSHSDTVRALAVSTDGRQAASGGDDHRIVLWNCSPFRPIRIFDGHKDQIYSLAFTPDERFLISSGKDQTVRIWDKEKGRCLRTIQLDHPGPASVFAFRDAKEAGAKGSLLRLIHYDPAVCKPADWAISLPASVGRVQANLRMFESLYPSAVRASSQQDYSAAAALLRRAFAIPGYEFDGRLLSLWQEIGIKAGQRIGLRSATCRQILSGHSRPVLGVVLSPDQGLGYSTGQDGTLRKWDLTTGEGSNLGNIPGEKGGLAISADGRKLLTWPLGWSFLSTRDLGSGMPYHDPKMYLLNLDGEKLTTFTMDADCTVEVAGFAKNDSFIYAGAEDGQMRVWDLETDHLLHKLSGPEQRASAACLSADDRQICAAGDTFYSSPMKDPNLYLWELSDGTLVQKFREPIYGEQYTGFALVAGIRAMRITDDGSRLFYARGGQVYIWDLMASSLKGKLTDETGPVNALEIVAGGSFLLAAGQSGALKLWDIQNQRCLRTLEGHTKAATCLAMSRDGSLAISGSEDGTLRVWEMNWEYDFPEPADWDERARPHLDVFLSLRIPRAGILPGDRAPSDNELTLALTRRGTPTWTEGDFQGLLRTLGCAGYGWLRPEGVRRKLEEMAKER